MTTSFTFLYKLTNIMTVSFPNTISHRTG